MSIELKEKAIALTYPPKPDAKGSARINWRRKPFYFGPHDTPESFKLFVEWKRRLVDSEGEQPIEVKVIRRDFAHKRLQDADIAKESKQNLLFALVAFAACFGFIAGAAAVFLVSDSNPSTQASAVVDGKKMSNSELEYVRGLRVHDGRLSSLVKANRSADLAELTLLLQKQGPRNGKIHEIRMDDGT